MALIGGQPFRQVVRAIPNPQDKSTIVSIFPREITEFKNTIFPGRFVIPAGSYEKPGILVVGTSSWWKELGDEQPALEIMMSSVQIAESVVKDYANGILLCNMNDLMPGLFFVPGEHMVEDIKKNHKDKLDRALVNQKNWYQALVNAADVLWAQTGGNPNSVDSLMKLAAKDLNLGDKPWLKDFVISAMTRCPACGTLVNPGFPICSNCRTVIDKEKYKALGLATV